MHHGPVCGKDYGYRTQREVCAAPDYKALYLELFRASVQAARLLQDAQMHAEQQIMEADPPPLRLEQTDENKTD